MVMWLLKWVVCGYVVIMFHDQNCDVHIYPHVTGAMEREREAREAEGEHREFDERFYRSEYKRRTSYSLQQLWKGHQR